MIDLYIAWRKVIRRIYRLPKRTHNFITMKLYIETRLDRRLAKFVFTMINNNNDVVKSITRFKLFSPSSVLAENYRYLLSVTEDPTTHTVKEFGVLF